MSKDCKYNVRRKRCCWYLTIAAAKIEFNTNDLIQLTLAFLEY